MPRREFVVGDKERHRVVVDVSEWTMDLKASIDGKEVPREAYSDSPYVPSSNWQWQSFSVGTKERHQVWVEMIAEVPPSIVIYVDGSPISM
jgi:hypothetical protein